MGYEALSVPLKNWLSPAMKHTGQESGGGLCEIFKF